MKCYQILFSPTGGTEKVAAAITQNWPEVQTIDLSSTSTDFASFFIESGSLVLVAMPSFGDVAPQLALDRFAQINGNRAKCVLVAVYGNRAYGSTLVQMEDTANAAGFQVIAAISAIAEHSIIHEYAAGRPNAADRVVQTAYLQNGSAGSVNTTDSCRARFFPESGERSRFRTQYNDPVGAGQKKSPARQSTATAARHKPIPPSRLSAHPAVRFYLAVR